MKRERKGKLSATELWSAGVSHALVVRRLPSGGQNVHLNPASPRARKNLPQQQTYVCT